MVDAVTHYALEVSTGRTVAGPWVRLACARHLADLDRGPGRGLHWAPELAERVFLFFECLTLGDGAHDGGPFVLEASQKFIVGSIYGWLGDDGYRRFRNAYIEIAKGNGKTPLAAGLALYALIADGEAGAEVYSAAVSRDQAKICFRDVRRFVEGSIALSRRLELGEHNIAFPATSSFLRTVSSEGRGLDGKRVALAVIDELHEHPTADVVDKMRAGTKGRRQPLIFEITNSGYDRHSVCWLHHQYTLKVLQQIIDNDEWFGYIAALDVDEKDADGKIIKKGDDWLNDPTCWIKANPLLGISITEKYLAGQVREARDMPSKRNIVARLNFCVWTEQVTLWMPLEAWDENGSPIDCELLRGRECFGGLDLASIADLAALVWVFPPRDETELWAIVCRLWCPEEGIRTRTKRDGVPYLEWMQEGLITATPGNVIDYAWIKAQIHRDAETFKVREIAYDRWNASQLVTELVDEGFLMVGFGQGWASMSAPMKALMKLVLGRRCAHGGHKVLRWMASNVSAKTDPAGNEKPDKSTSGDKIDGIVALLMGLGRAIVTPEETPSVYESRGVLTL